MKTLKITDTTHLNLELMKVEFKQKGINVKTLSEVIDQLINDWKGKHDQQQK